MHQVVQPTMVFAFLLLQDYPSINSILSGRGVTLHLKGFLCLHYACDKRVLMENVEGGSPDKSRCVVRRRHDGTSIFVSIFFDIKASQYGGYREEDLQWRLNTSWDIIGRNYLRNFQRRTSRGICLYRRQDQNCVAVTAAKGLTDARSRRPFSLHRWELPSHLLLSSALE